MRSVLDIFQKQPGLSGKLLEHRAKRGTTNLYHQMVQLREMSRFTVELPASFHKFVIKIDNSLKSSDVICLKCASCHVHVHLFCHFILL